MSRGAVGRTRGYEIAGRPFPQVLRRGMWAEGREGLPSRPPDGTAPRPDRSNSMSTASGPRSLVSQGTPASQPRYR
jgi:hypothetical protein